MCQGPSSLVGLIVVLSKPVFDLNAILFLKPFCQLVIFFLIRIRFLRLRTLRTIEFQIVNKFKNGAFLIETKSQNC